MESSHLFWTTLPCILWFHVDIVSDFHPFPSPPVLYFPTLTSCWKFLFDDIRSHSDAARTPSVTCTHTHTHIHITHTHTHHTHTHTCVCVTHTHMCVCVCGVCVFVCVCVCVCVCVYECVYTCIYVYICRDMVESSFTQSSTCMCCCNSSSSTNMYLKILLHAA